jgi:hypothetical protein
MDKQAHRQMERHNYIGKYGEIDRREDRWTDRQKIER